MEAMKTRFARFEDSTVNSCRWSEYAQELLGDWDIVYDGSTSDYQGTVEILAHKEGRFAYLTYSYGSCSGCDGWEDMEDEARRADFKNLVEYFGDVHELKKFAEQVNYGKDFNEAIEEYLFHAELERELSK